MYIFKIFIAYILLTSLVYAEDYIIDTDIGGDIDDVIAVLVALNDKNKPLAIITNHIEPIEKAKIAKLLVTETGLKNIPVYAGVGVTRRESTDLFQQQNPLWPAVYGYPHPKPNHKAWYLLQSKAYRNVYPYFDNLPIERESAPEFIAKLAKNYSAHHKLKIIAIGPLHNIAAALKLDPSISNKIVLYSMGGTYPKGYNWLISPEQTFAVISKVETICISTEFIERNNFVITSEEYNEIKSKKNSLLAKAIIHDWDNWNHHKIGKAYISDPVTVYLALHPEEIRMTIKKAVEFPCLKNGKLKAKFKGQSYNAQGLKNLLIKTGNSDVSNVSFVTKVTSVNKIKQIILNAINTKL